MKSTKIKRSNTSTESQHQLHRLGTTENQMTNAMVALAVNITIKKVTVIVATTVMITTEDHTKNHQKQKSRKNIIAIVMNGILAVTRPPMTKNVSKRKQRKVNDRDHVRGLDQGLEDSFKKFIFYCFKTNELINATIFRKWWTLKLEKLVNFIKIIYHHFHNNLQETK
jgi:hypothetical protein